MVSLIRAKENPVLLPSSSNDWERHAAFNGSVMLDKEIYHMVYRAQSAMTYYQGHNLSLSTIGYANSKDGMHFNDHRQLIKPEQNWEIFGCEDPRITYFENKYYIFYTALSNYPFNAAGIKVGVAISSDLQNIEEKHLVTPFNAKAMALFPERVNGKIAVILAANTDLPPSKIAIAYFDRIEELWDEAYWKNWYAYLDDHTIPLLRNGNDQVEVGAVPVKTDHGWLLIYSYIQNYHSDHKVFGIEAALLDPDNPVKILARTKNPLLIPETDYERFGDVPNIVFPTGAVIQGGILHVYYGAADTNVSLARCNLNDLLGEISSDIKPVDTSSKLEVKRFEENPILVPLPENHWESRAVFNPAAVYEGGKVHLVYRAWSEDYKSTFGYAVSTDGFHIDERLVDPIYTPRDVFEKRNDAGNAGCEDPRITKIDNRFYMLYTAYDGNNPPRVAMSSIAVDDFMNRNWQWEIPKLISPPGKDDKDACIFPKKIKDKYVFIHRLQTSIWIDYQDDLHFLNGKYLEGKILLHSGEDKWVSSRIGIAGVPIETEKGWLMLYHGIGPNSTYKISALLLDLNDPEKIISRLEYPFFKPEMHYEREGQIPNVVFPCGHIVIDGTIFIYYGGADTVVGVATIELDRLLKTLLK